MLTREQKRLRSYCIYFLRDPANLQVRYIGMSSNVSLRKNAHWSDRLFARDIALEAGTKCAWLKSLALQGLKPLLEVVLSGLTLEQAEQVETRLIFIHSQVNRHLLMQAKVDVSRNAKGSISFKQVPHRNFFRCVKCNASTQASKNARPYGWGFDTLGNDYCRLCVADYRPFATLNLLPPTAIGGT
jgi:hypothetical protein